MSEEKKKLPITILAAPGSLAKERSADCRIAEIVLTKEKCTPCMICYDSCPEGAINLDRHAFPAIDETHCKGCGICVQICPKGGLRMVPLNEGHGKRSFKKLFKRA